MNFLFKRHFQTAYVAANAKAAVATFSSRFGIAKWDIMDMQALHGAASPAKMICTAWVGEMMIELIEPNPAVPSIYCDWNAPEDNNLRLHHLGFLVDSEHALSETKTHLMGQGFPIVMDGSFGDVLDFAYADTRSALGHYYEIIWPKEQGDSFFSRIPVN